MWMFESEPFQTWLEKRQGRDRSADLPPALRGRCLSCGTQLELVSFEDHGTCGFCLAYEFGQASEEERLASAISGLAQVATATDPEPFRYVCRQLLVDVHSALELADSMLAASEGADR